jgi:Fe-S-cluster-containing dehydrogenase component
MKEYAILLDDTYCTGCNTCAYRCVQEFRYHKQAEKGFFRTFVMTNDDGLYHKRCMHCADAECVKNCPVKALTKSGYGPVLYSAETCIGCGTCVSVCPFGIPKLDEATKKIVKCSMCAHKAGKGVKPSCVEVCPTGALRFGEYGEMMKAATDLAKKGKLTVFGRTEAGGTHLLILTKGDPSAKGYPNVAKAPPKGKKSFTEAIEMPSIAAAAMVGFEKLIERKEKVAKEKKES